MATDKSAPPDALAAARPASHSCDSRTFWLHSTTGTRMTTPAARLRRAELQRRTQRRDSLERLDRILIKTPGAAMPLRWVSNYFFHDPDGKPISRQLVRSWLANGFVKVTYDGENAVMVRV